MCIRDRVTSVQDDGSEKFIDYLNAGEHFGEMAILTEQVRVVTMAAVMDSRLLELNRVEFQQLVQKVPQLATNVSRALGHRLRQETTGKKTSRVSRVIGIINPLDDASDFQLYGRLVTLLAATLTAKRIPIQIVTDNADAIETPSLFRISEIPRNMNPKAKVAWVHQRLSLIHI